MQGTNERKLQHFNIYFRILRFFYGDEIDKRARYKHRYPAMNIYTNIIISSSFFLDVILFLCGQYLFLHLKLHSSTKGFYKSIWHLQMANHQTALFRVYVWQNSFVFENYITTLQLNFTTFCFATYKFSKIPYFIFYLNV